MEPQTQQLMEPQTQQLTEDGGSNQAPGSSANMHCRRSSTRWAPPTDQIRILRELYYDKGVKSPTTEQIQRICLELKQYGNVEGKNVFYWFQNLKARERQKKRFTSDVHLPMQRSGLVGSGNGTNWKPEDQYINFRSSASASAPSAGVMAFNGQMGNYGGHGSMNMDKSFRDCSISAGGGTSSIGVGGSITEIETLPLFPMHGEDISGNKKTTSEGGSGYGYYSGGWGGYNDDSHISLQLSLNPAGAADLA